MLVYKSGTGWGRAYDDYITDAQHHAGRRKGDLQVKRTFGNIFSPAFCKQHTMPERLIAGCSFFPYQGKEYSDSFNTFVRVWKILIPVNRYSPKVVESSDSCKLLLSKVIGSSDSCELPFSRVVESSDYSKSVFS